MIARRWTLTTIVLLGLTALLLACGGSKPLLGKAYPKAQVKGIVTCAETGEPVIGAAVMVIGTTRGAMTDFDGVFYLRSLPPGICSLRITHLDYETVELDGVLVVADSLVTLEQSMKKKPLDSSNLLIGSSRRSVELVLPADSGSARPEDFKRKPVISVDDLLKQVAGVVLDPDGPILIRPKPPKVVPYDSTGRPSVVWWSPEIVDCDSCGSIQGTLTDLGSGLPVIGAEVHCLNPLVHTFSDSSGLYVFPTMLPRPTSLLFDHKDYYKVLVEDIGVSKDSVSRFSHALSPIRAHPEIDFDLKPPIMEDPEEAFIRSLREKHPYDSLEIDTTHGNVIVRTEDGLGVMYSIEHAAEGGDPIYFDQIDVIRPGSVRGTITAGQTGLPVHGAEIKLFGAQSAGRSDFDGEYAVFGFAGVFKLLVTHPDYISYEVEHVELVNGETTHLSVELKRKVTRRTNPEGGR